MPPSKTAPRPATPDALATIDQVSVYLGITVKTLYQWRWQGIGPRSVKIGKYIRYDWADVRSWFEQKKADEKTAEDAA